MKVKYGKGGSSDGMYAEAGALITGLAKNKNLREAMKAEIAKYENGGSVTGGDKGDKGAKGKAGGKFVGMEVTMVNDKEANEKRANQELLDSLIYNETTGNLQNEEGERMYIGSVGLPLSKEAALELRAAERAFMEASQESDSAEYVRDVSYRNPKAADTKKGRRLREKKNDESWDRESAAIDAESDQFDNLLALYEKYNIPQDQRFIREEKSGLTGGIIYVSDSTDEMKSASNRWTGGDLQNRSGYNKAIKYGK
jgi:hypothetical protein